MHIKLATSLNVSHHHCVINESEVHVSDLADQQVSAIDLNTTAKNTTDSTVVLDEELVAGK